MSAFLPVGSPRSARPPRSEEARLSLRDDDIDPLLTARRASSASGPHNNVVAVGVKADIKRQAGLAGLVEKAPLQTDAPIISFCWGETFQAQLLQLHRHIGEGGTVLKTSLDHTKEAALQAALAGIQAAVPSLPA
jgi:hypothetical protein